MKRNDQKRAKMTIYSYNDSFPFLSDNNFCGLNRLRGTLKLAKVFILSSSSSWSSSAVIQRWSWKRKRRKIKKKKIKRTIKVSRVQGIVKRTLIRRVNNWTKHFRSAHLNVTLNIHLAHFNSFQPFFSSSPISSSSSLSSSFSSPLHELREKKCEKLKALQVSCW